jgi:hypothetical protein
MTFIFSDFKKVKLKKKAQNLEMGGLILE